MKLKTNHGTFLSLTRDSSVKAVATGRTGFRVMSEGGKYVFTHESGKILGVAGGQVCGMEKRQHERPQQDITSDFGVVTIAEGATAVPHAAVLPTVAAKTKGKASAPVLPPAAAEDDPFAFDPAPPADISSKRPRKPAERKTSEQVKSLDAQPATTRRGKTAAAGATVATAAADDSDDDKPFKFPRAAAAEA